MVLLTLALLALLGLAAATLVFRHFPVLAWWAPDRIERAGPAPHRPAPRQVVLVSIDGLAPRLLSEADSPELVRLARQGWRAEVARTVVPSITLASHVSMLSGVPPRVHGVDFNAYRPWFDLEVPTVFSVCAREGLRCGLFTGKPKLAHLADGEPGVERFVRGREAAAVFEAALAYLQIREADLAVVHLAEVDVAGHAAGWGSPDQRASLASLDTLLGRFVSRACAAAARPMVLLVTADHGGEGFSHGSDRPADRRIPWLLWGDGIPAGTLAEVSILDTAPTLAALLGVKAWPGWQGEPRLPAAAGGRAAAARCHGGAAAGEARRAGRDAAG